MKLWINTQFRIQLPGYTGQLLIHFLDRIIFCELS